MNHIIQMSSSYLQIIAESHVALSADGIAAGRDGGKPATALGPVSIISWARLTARGSSLGFPR
jgi:hypothetical protein